MHLQKIPRDYLYNIPGKFHYVVNIILKDLDINQVVNIHKGVNLSSCRKKTPLNHIDIKNKTNFCCNYKKKCIYNVCCIFSLDNQSLYCVNICCQLKITLDYTLLKIIRIFMLLLYI